MPDLTFEQWLTLLVTVGGALGAVWAFIAKTYFPARQKLRELEAEEAGRQREHEREQQRRLLEEADRQREHERGIQKDQLEHDQELESRGLNNNALRAAVREDKIAELLEKDSSFIREEAREGLDKIKADSFLIPSIRDDVKFIKHEQANLRADFRLLLGITQDIYERWKAHQDSTGDS